jgi:hypothetical protein
VWFFAFWRGDKELIYQRLGFRIIVVALFLAWTTNNWPFFNPSSYMNGDEKITIVATQLRAGNLPEMPRTNRLLGERTDVWLHDVLGGKDYFYYINTRGKVPHLRIDRSLCAIVEYEKEMAFRTTVPPIYAGNVKFRVRYTKKQEFTTLMEKLSIVIHQWENPFVAGFQTVTHWEALRENWHTVDTNHSIIATGERMNKIPDRKALGGIVCFEK